MTPDITPHPTIKARCVVVIVSLVVVILIMAIKQLTPYNYTDHAENKTRSGLTIYTDYYTGCQYLATQYGGLTPRRRPSGTGLTGKHICLVRNSYQVPSTK